MKLLTFIFLLIFVTSVQAHGYREPTPLPVRAVRLHGKITIDGILSEPAWKSAPPTTDFTQAYPNEGEKPTEKTVVRVLYSNNAIYIGARMYDNHPDSIIALLGRRDAHLQSDKFFIFLDPFHDGQTGFYFGLSAGGTIYDGTLFNDVRRDNSWNGVWEGKVHRDSKGWTAEFKIPFSQLRFQKEKQYVWGINFERVIERNHEKDYLAYTPQNGNGFVSRFPNLIGMKNIKPKSDFEVIPYVTTKASYLPHDPGDPFNSGAGYNINTGAVIKTSVGSNLTMDATINPDFGQVEVDPAVVNLSDVETFYPEKRPFFIEGRNYFNFGHGGATSYWNFGWPKPTLFYSRRIGEKPQGSVPSATYVDYPSATHIIGAAKLTGETENNWNIGTLEAVTSPEIAKYEVSNKIYHTQVQPLTNYSVLSLRKQFDNSRYSIGMLGTFTARKFIDQNLANQMNKTATVLGMDGYAFLDPHKAWVFSGWMSMSNITGNKKDMLAVQTDPRHYFQRPDARTYGIDSTMTSMTGLAGHFVLNKQKGNFFVNSSFGFINPYFDPNDLGYLGITNVINAHLGVGYKWTNPTSWYRNINLRGAVFTSYDFDGNHTSGGFWNAGNFQLLNYYGFGWHIMVFPKHTINNRLTRGGPLSIGTAGISYGFYLYTNGNKKLTMNTGFGSYTYRGGSHGWSYFINANWKPMSSVVLSIGPHYSRHHAFAQWVGAYNDPYAKATYGKQYVFAHMNQQTISANVSFNWTFTPNLSLQFFAQPLISSGNYYNFMSLEKPKTYDFMVFGKDGSTFNPKTYVADPDGSGPAPSFQIDNPDFNYKSLRGDAVLRWEYRPGSTIYLVWTQTRSQSQTIGSFNLNNSINTLLTTKPDNVFLLKFSYWLDM